MTVNTNGPLAGQETPRFSTADLAAYTQRLIGEMDRGGTKIRRDEWEFGQPSFARIRTNYAHRELRLHVQAFVDDSRWMDVDRVSINLDATDVVFPTLNDLLRMALRVTGAETIPDPVTNDTGTDL